MTPRRTPWGLYVHAHRGVVAVGGWLLLTVVATLFAGRMLRFPGIVRPQPTPVVALASMGAMALVAWVATPRTSLEAVSVRPLWSVPPLLTLAVVAASGTTCLLLTGDATFARTLVASAGLVLSGSALGLSWGWASSLCPLVLVLSSGLAGAVPGVRWWGFYLSEQAAATWLIPCVLLLVGVIGQTRWAGHGATSG